MAARHILYFTSEDHYLYRISGRTLELEAQFPGNEQGIGEFRDFLRGRRGTLFSLVADLAGEDFHEDQIPFLRGADRKAVVQRRLAQRYRDTRLAAALSLGVVGWMLTARLVRGQLISLRKQDYVHAARALGARRRQVLRRHLLPNSLGVLAVALLLELPTIVIGEAFLAVLGLGPQPPTATWGNIVDEGLHFGRVWQMTIATGMIVLFALAANVIVDALSEALDPRSQVARRSPLMRRAEA